jgi:transposase InsO family protein
MANGGVPVSVRRAIVDADVSAMNVTAFCHAHGISTWFFYDLRRRYAVDGDDALELRSRAAKRVANRIDDVVRDRIVELRKQLDEEGLDCGPATIQFHLLREDGPVPSTSTIWRVLRERGFVVPNPRKAPRRTYRRFTAEWANECWQIDATTWTLATGDSIEIINVIDDCTRVLIASCAVKTCTTANTWSALCVASEQWGWPERLLSDNGSAFRGGGPNRNSQGGLIPLLAAIGIRDSHSRPYHPQTCGKVERFHQTLKKYLARWATSARSLEELQAIIDRFKDIYNHQRPHRALGRRIPADVWHTTPRSGPATIPLGTTTRTVVDTNGQLQIKGRFKISLGAAHRGAEALAVVTGLQAHVFIGGKLIRQLTIDPTKRTQAIYDRPGKPKKKV